MSMDDETHNELARLGLTIPASVEAYRSLVLSMPGAETPPYRDRFGLYSEALLAFFDQMAAGRARRPPARRQGGKTMRRRKHFSKGMIHQ